MTKSRYTKPGKTAAYKSARRLAADITDRNLARVGMQTYNDLVIAVTIFHPELPAEDVNQVSAKALRVERGNRKRAGGHKAQINVRLSAADLRLLDDLTAEFGGQSQAVRLAVRALHRATF